MHISIVIPAYNEEKYIGNTLEKLKMALLANQYIDFQYEIIVCNNNSTDQTAVVATQMGAKVVFEPINQISGARNRGAASALGDWLIFLDADSYPSSGLIKDMLDLIQNNKHIGCGTTVKVEGGSLFNKLRMERLNPLFRLFKLSGGVFIVCQKDAFQQIGGFSTNLYAYEEFDFIRRLKRYGRSQKKKFTVLYKNPVITSGRKGEVTFFNLWTLITSNVYAMLLFILQYILPQKWLKVLSTRLLKYWYQNRKS